MAAIPNVGGRDIAEILAPQGSRRQPMPGFGEEYSDIVDYILRCTHRIWEQKDLGLIATHYAPDIRVHTMTGPVDGVGGVIAGTARTLSAFPDRTLTGEVVIWSAQSEGAYFSSHRITRILAHPSWVRQPASAFRLQPLPIASAAKIASRKNGWCATTAPWHSRLAIVRALSPQPRPQRIVLRAKAAPSGASKQ